ncbi:hypothetical protein GCM10007880_18860 [Mesorhizobium amorphae]|uniref:Uncharacterized protein n=1 Tax=Mesorhizobium amorphae CCNWGS0123 TaxID=1082933 RepID=G6Y2F3_9HYPH|nr:hypothetical protein A6B35_28015 [Mesorhizobium amorphae CCNWGS0123]EHH14136.1 hypothetical protein MEA186_00465 [Mesorhizobium amorphae CCNWGS0123]GLR41370.1 hypothetical protein GCM10007880_18860 [Mesorhizobium amorphae]
MAASSILPKYVRSLSYDAKTRTGILMMEPYTNCDFEECTSLFERIDRKVAAIHTFSGAERDTSYIRVGRSAGWSAKRGDV